LLVKLVFILMFRRVDAVHICSSGSLGLVRDIAITVLSRLRGVRVILHLHFGRTPAALAARKWEAALLRIVCALAKSAVVLDSISAETLRRMVPECTVSLIPNPAWRVAEVGPARVDPTAVRALVFVGYVTPEKGVRELVRACCEIKDREFRLDLIGPVPVGFAKELERIARNRGGGGWLRMTGAVDNKEAFARIADAFAVILPSYSEGFPITILEAMMLGKPVIATAVGAVAEMLLDGGDEPCGICVPVRDVDALRLAIQSLLEQPSHALELGHRGRTRVVERYSPELIYPHYRALWFGSKDLRQPVVRGRVHLAIRQLPDSSTVPVERSVDEAT
jgi:glycosyltransferase involved in cell wall biosynthesis